MNPDNDLSNPPETAKEKVQHALATARQQTGDAVARGGEYVRERPAVSLGSAFAVGFALGALAVLAARQKPSPRKSLSAESRERLAELFGNVRGPWEKTYSSVSDSASALSDSVTQALQKVTSGKGKCRWW